MLDLLGNNNDEQLGNNVSQFKITFHGDFFLRQSVEFIYISR